MKFLKEVSGTWQIGSKNHGNFTITGLEKANDWEPTGEESFANNLRKVRNIFGIFFLVEPPDECRLVGI